MQYLIQGTTSREVYLEILGIQSVQIINVSCHSLGSKQSFQITISVSDSTDFKSNIELLTRKFSESVTMELLNTEQEYVLTMLCQNGISTASVKQITQLLFDNNASLKEYKYLSNEASRILVSTGADLNHLRDVLYQFSNSIKIDLILQKTSVFRKQKRLVVFDMDSTLIQQEVIDEIAKYAGVVDKVAKITEAAMNGEIDFCESLKRRVALLKGTNPIVLDEIKNLISFTPGAKELCKCLKKLGFKLAVVSGGFIPLARYVQHELGLDYAFANQLEVSSDGTEFTGTTVGPIVDANRKMELLKLIAECEGLDLNQVVAVGDGANDLLMMQAAGLGVAFNAKPRVQKLADARINQKSLLNLLYLLGYSLKQVQEMLG